MHIATHTESFPRTYRLSTVRDFATVFEGRARRRTEHFTVCYVPSSLPHARLGVSVPKRIGNAPHRNRIKRLVRETFRKTKHALHAYDIVIVARHDCQPRCGQIDVQRELVAVWNACGIISTDQSS
jgi:ribonuclease P protein component